MSLPRKITRLSDSKFYTQRQFGITRRSRVLPKDQLEELAREALRRLASRRKISALLDAEHTALELEKFCTALISKDDMAAADFVVALQDQSVPAEAIYNSYIAAAAKLLGLWWEQDRVGFWQVTLATGRLLSIMRSMADEFDNKSLISNKNAVFAAVPGEQHVIGLHMAVDLFRKDGWNVIHKVGLDHDTLIADLEQTPTDVIGLSISGTHALKALSKLLIALQISLPSVPILVCGHDVQKMWAKLVGMEVDIIATDIDNAKAQLEALFGSNKLERL